MSPKSQRGCRSSADVECACRPTGTGTRGVDRVGQPDADRPGSEIVKAIIQLKEGIKLNETVKANIKEYASTHLSKYEMPRIWEYSEALPLTAVGKVLKRELREEARKEE